MALQGCIELGQQIGQRIFTTKNNYRSKAASETHGDIVGSFKSSITILPKEAICCELHTKAGRILTID